jgi:hypothetical protein
VSTGYDSYFRLDMPPNCQLPRPVEPVHNPADPQFRATLHTYLTRRAMAGSMPHLIGTPVTIDDWNLWEKIEPNFRLDTEGELYEQHYQVLRVRARLAWWQANAGTVENCIKAARARPLTNAQAVALHAEVVEDNKAIVDRAVVFDGQDRSAASRRSPVGTCGHPSPYYLPYAHDLIRRLWRERPNRLGTLRILR